jgi:hypothetical protein
MRKVLEIGGLVAGVVLIAFGVVAIVMGVNGRTTVNNAIKAEQIVGSADMTPTAIKAEALSAKLDLNKIQIPTCTVANVAVTNGATARCFAEYMRIHTFEATGGATYSQMGQFVALANAPKSQLAVGGGTSNKVYAQIDPTTKQPVSNGARNVWVTETALTTALNTSYMASQLALFGLVVGIALLLSGFGFAILAIGGALRNSESPLGLALGKRTRKAVVPTPVPTA